MYSTIFFCDKFVIQDGWLLFFDSDENMSVEQKFSTVENASHLVVLPRKALVRSHTAALILLGTIGTIGLVAQQGGGIGRVAESGQHTAQGIRQEEIGVGRRGGAGQFPDEATAQAVVIGAALQRGRRRPCL